MYLFSDIRIVVAIFILKFTHLVLRDKAFKVDPSAP